MNISKAQWYLWLFGMFKIPMIGFCRPGVVVLDKEKVVIKIKLTRRTRNHLRSMYFGTLAIGADLAGGFQAFLEGRETKTNLSLVFNNFSADFLKRPEGDVFFEARNGEQVRKMIQKSRDTASRVTEPVTIHAFTDYYGQKEEVAVFSLGLSLKVKP